MLHRRHFIAAATSALAAPYILKTAKATTPRLRRDVTKLAATDPFFAKYGDAVKKMHDLPASDGRNWRNQALIHLKFCAHGRLDFFHWHRHYIANFEAICGELIGDPEFALPYWNWSANNGRIPDPFYDIDHLNVKFWKDPSNASSPNWNFGQPVNTTGVRNLSKGRGLQDDPHYGGSFKQSALDDTLKQSDFDSFTFSIEGSPHNNGHVVAGASAGHIGNGMSPLDPIFWLHHCNVDRLWAQWQGAGNDTPSLSGKYASQFVDAKGNPVTTATSANAIHIADFGYTYDILRPVAASPSTSRLSLQPFRKQILLQPQSIKNKPRSFGVSKSPQKASMRVETRFPIQADSLLSNLFETRTYWATDFVDVQRLAVEPGRVLARLSQVTPPEKPTPMVVNVFANCPYLSPETDSTDLHYAGSFSFFGTHEHGEGAFYVDMTNALQGLAADGRLATELVAVQLMPLPLNPEEKATFSVESVELLAV